MKLKDKPWINNRILKMMRIEDRILQKFKKRQSPDNLQLYKKFRNHVYNELKESKARYYHNYFLTNSQNMKKMWSGIKSIVSHKSFTSSSINKIKGNDGNVASEPSDMSNIFNNFYINVASSITKTIPITPESPLDYLTNRASNSLFLTPVTPLEVKDIIDALNPSKSVGPNSIPIKLLKIVGCSISPLLALLMNHSFQSGIYPDTFKIAKVISLFKKGNPELPSNYRPISLLSIFSKIFEKLMYKRLYSFLEVHNILYSLQFGFQENHSIDHALVSLTESVKNTLDNKRLGCGIFIDLQELLIQLIIKFCFFASRGLGILRYAKRYLPLVTVQAMYKSLIEPYFRYCCPVWGATGNTALQKLQKLQNRAARIVTNSPYDAHSEPLLLRLGWPTVTQLIELETVKVVYKVLHNEAPDYLNSLFHKLSDSHCRMLRNSKTDLRIPMFKSSYGQKSFEFRGANNWNNLRNEAKTANTFLAFKSNL